MKNHTTQYSTNTTLLRIASINVNGFRDTHKQKELFGFIRENNLDIVGIQEFNLKIPHIPLTNYNIEIGYNGKELGTAIIFKKELMLTETEKTESGRIMKVVLDGITIINVYGYQPGLGAKLIFECDIAYSQDFRT